MNTYMSPGKMKILCFDVYLNILKVDVTLSMLTIVCNWFSHYV